MGLIICHIANFTSFSFSCFFQVPIVWFASITNIMRELQESGLPDSKLPVNEQDPKDKQLYVFTRMVYITWVLLATTVDNYLR